MTKVFTLLHRKAGWSRSAFSDYWGSTHKEHALDLARAGFFTGYVQNHLIAELKNPVWPVADGIPEIWVPSTESLAEIAASELYQQGAARDEGNFTTGEITSYITGSAPELGLPLLSSQLSRIRLLVFLHISAPERLVDYLGQANRAEASDIFITASAADGVAQCVVISEFWEEIEPACRAMDNINEQLLRLPGMRPLNAGLYRTNTVVDPQTGTWG